ncbi:uncharacterized protein EURHEDRAFT_408147 [Aspergillus ruber CBS 135680]|uniref:Uncharacterized protein n=1 Tax=Aspergillus ruber (strain CBS 135680) TaxID=1388766 RepID=A0A017SPL8_ASPRC|nr:uncharacterized protein EURHEDRAFT_408147 [Aspergillus ruber CBS 135680]EYE98928.1 hypothetical protein EURHEDRAFT_408147 [Aspergillus ruber CBS 135680]
MPLLLLCGFGVPSPIGFGETRGLGLQEYPVQAVWANTGSQGNGEVHIELAHLCANRFPVACSAQARRSRIAIPADCSRYTMNASHERETSAVQPVILRQPVLPHLRVREG